MKKRKWRWMKIEISREADRYTRSLARRCGVSRSRVMALIITMELDKMLGRRKKES